MWGRDHLAGNGSERHRFVTNEGTPLLALAGKVSSDLLEIIRERPTAVGELLRAMRGLSAKRRDGDW